MKHYLSYLREFRQTLPYRLVIFNGEHLCCLTCVRATGNKLWSTTSGAVSHS